MDNENIAAILKDAINASSTKIQSESKRTKVFVLPPELLKDLLVKNEIPKKANNSTTKAETSSTKNNKKTTRNKRQSVENSKSATLPVDRPKRTNKKSTANKDLKNTKSQTFSKKKKEDPRTILDKNQEKCTEIIHELSDCSINATSDKALDSCSKEKCTVEILHKIEERGTKMNHELQDYPINEISSCEKKSSDETIKLGDIKTAVIDKILQDPHIEMSQGNARETILNGEISSHVELNDEKGVNSSSSKSIQLPNDEETTIMEEKTYIVEEIIEIVESGEEKVLEENVKENYIHSHEVLLAENTGLSKPTCAANNVKTEPISKTISIDLEPIVKQKRSNTVRVYVNKKKRRKQTSNNDAQERSIPQINDDYKKDSVNETPKEVSLHNLCEESQNLKQIQEKLNPEIDRNYRENNLITFRITDAFDVNQCSEIEDLQKIEQSDSKTRGDDDRNIRPNIAEMETAIPNVCEKLQDDNVTWVEEVNKSSSTDKPIHSVMETDATVGDDNASHDSDLNTIGIDDKIKEKPEKCALKLFRPNSRHDGQESNIFDTQAPCKDNIKKTKRYSKVNDKRDVVESDNEPKNIGKDSSNMSVRKSGRRQKSNVNYCVPDENVDVYDSEKRGAKESTENAPKKRRGRPRRKDALSKPNAPTERNLEHQQESTQKDTTLNDRVLITVNDVDSSIADISNISIRERRATKRRTINEDLFEVESEPTKQEKSLDTSVQSQADTLLDAADGTNDFEDSQVSDKCEEEDIVEESKPRRGRKRKYSFNAHLTKRRGRPPIKRKVESNDDDYTPHHSYVPRSTKVKEKSKETPKVVKCGKCGKEVPKNQWYSHNLYSHNDMGWLDGAEKPDFETDPKLLTRVLTAAHKKKHKKGLVCEACREVKKSVVGFISHMTFCGKTDEEIASLLVTCDQCGAKFKPSSMEYHERQHRLEVEGKKKREKEMAEKIVDIFEPRSKRKAAEKAVSKISEFTALVKDDDGCSATKKLKLSSPLIKKFIQKPLATKKISSILVAKWRRELDNNQDAACTQLGCQFTCKSMDEIREHYASCNFTVTENYVCKVCRFQTLFEDEIIKHAAEKHTSEDLDINAAMSDAEASDSEDYSDLDEDDSNKSQGLVKKFFYKETSDVENKMFKFIFNNGACHTILNKTFLPGFQWTLEFERKHFKFSIFNDYTPNVFTLMEEKDAESYLPELDSSLPARFMKKDGNLNEPEWKKWSRFEATRVDDCPTFFVGGPVWAMAWAPTPSYLAISDELPQFLAVSTHPKMDIEYSVGESYSGKNIIQIWNVGKLNNRNPSENDPELSYAITHDGGTVWSLEWCPSGCYQHEDFPDLRNESDSNRLGLLAAGCSDGIVRIYSLVFPQELVHSSNEHQYPIYKTEPIIQLIVSSDMYENNEQNWQVMKLSWSRESNHNVIVAGLSNGYVAFWDLTTKSPMLKYKVNNTTFLRPYRQFFAHHHAVTMVALVPQDNKRYLATASLDKLYKFWDLEDISRPKNTYKKSYVTDGAWFNNWCCAILGHDNALCSSGNNSAVCLPLRNYTYKYFNILPSNSTIYGVSTSDFGNSVATGNVAGELLTLFPHQLVYIRDMEKTIPPKRSLSLVSTTELVDFYAEQVNEIPVEKGKKMKNEPYSDPTQFMPSTYNDSKDRFGILFNNKINPLKSNSKSVQKYKKKPTLTCEHLEQTPIEQYPLKSINKVAWNPNASSFLWLATGYQNGFVRLISFRSVASTAEWNKLLQSHTNALKDQMAKTAAEDSS